MDKIELARKTLLENVGYESFPCGLMGSEGGACGGGYTSDYEELELSADELLYLISDGSEVFNGLSMEEVDVDARLREMAKEACWPDNSGNPSVYLSDKNTVPEELKGLADEIKKHDKNDAVVVADLRARIAAFPDDDYTFYVTIKNFDYYFTENESVALHLTGDQVRGFLRFALYDITDVFDGICDEEHELNEDDFSNLAKEAGIGSDYVDNYYIYSGECMYLEYYVEAWKTLISKIMSGEVDEANLNKCPAFFDNRDEWGIWYRVLC